MKDVLILGGLGKIGYELVEKLIDTNCNITVLDLESNKSKKIASNIKNKVRIVFGDVEDKDLIKDLVKRNDIIVHYAGIMPPLADLNDTIAINNNFNGVKNVVDAIDELNPECLYYYMSFISVYGVTNEVKRTLNTSSNDIKPGDYYSKSLLKSEEYIREKLKKYTIFRMPIVLTRKNYYIKHMAFNRVIDFITVNDVNEIILNSVKSKKIYGKTYDISGFKADTNEMMKRLYRATGSISLLKRNLYYGEYEDDREIDLICKIKYTEIDKAIKEIKNNTNPLKVFIKKIINYPIYLIFKFKIKN